MFVFVLAQWAIAQVYYCYKHCSIRLERQLGIKVLIALLNGTSSVSSIYDKTVTTTCNFRSRRPDALFGTPQASAYT